jgi:hypothetical protein
LFVGILKSGDYSQVTTNLRKTTMVRRVSGYSSTSDAISGLKKQLSENSLKIEQLQIKHLASPRQRKGEKPRRSYLTKRHEASDAQERRSRISSAMFSSLDNILGEDKLEKAGITKDIDSYLRSLLQSNKDIDNSSVKKLKRRKKSKKSSKKATRDVKQLLVAPGEDSVSTAATVDLSNCSLSSLTEELDDDIDYSWKYKPFDSHTIDIELPPRTSETADSTVRFSSTGECGFVDDELSDTDYDRLFYTDDDLAEQRHEAFVEMCERSEYDICDDAAYSSFGTL